MRILLVVHGFPPAATGGTEIYADAHARTLRDRFGDDVFVLAREQDPSRPDYAMRRESRRGIDITWINNTFRKTVSFAETSLNPAIDTAAARLIDRVAPDVAHVHHLTCLSTGIVRTLADRSIPVFMTLHDYWLICHRGQLLDVACRVCPGPEPSGCPNCLGAAAGIGRTGYAGAAGLRSIAGSLPPALSRRLLAGARWTADGLASRRRAHDEAHRRLSHMREVCGAVSTFFAPSAAIRQRFIEFGVAPERISLAPYGIEPRKQVIPCDRSGPLRIGYAGSLMISKAPHLAIEAFERLPPGSATLDIFGAYSAYHGDDSYWRTLAKWVGDRRLRFHGGVPHHRAGEMFLAIDVLVVPSIWPETSPIVIHEALDAGVPVVASKIGGIPETVIDGVNGLLFTPGDADDLHRVLARLIAEPELIEQLRRGTRRAKAIDDDVAFTRSFYPDRAVSSRSPVAATPPTADPAETRTAAIVLSHGSPDEAMLAVRSLQGSRLPIRIIVVENGARPETRDALAALGGDVTVIQTGRNLGFPAGMNVGIRAAIAGGATHLFLVNSDMIVPPDCLDQLHTAMTGTGAGIAGPVILSRSRPDRIGTIGISYRSATGRMKHESVDVHVPSMDVVETAEVDAICGCAMLVTREVVDAVGLLDEEYFFSFEDLDWCFRARRAGFASVLAADATAYHQGSATMGNASPLRLYYAARNHLRFAGREGRGDAAGSLASMWRGTSILALNVAHAVRARGGSLPARLAAVARGTRDHLAGRYGESIW